MEEMVVTKMWMLGIIGIMVLYGICVLIGLPRLKKQGK